MFKKQRVQQMVDAANGPGPKSLHFKRSSSKRQVLLKNVGNGEGHFDGVNDANQNTIVQGPDIKLKVELTQSLNYWLPFSSKGLVPVHHLVALHGRFPKCNHPPAGWRCDNTRAA